ncbi:hypothetical protein [Marinibactrum halimedae]|uniref:Uncharacterized protein n=1 Tax=Marinibactrum halimedae TaxID=1444977 RepID=A0AA37WN97_9GAMM|nr:hypothetical protein [Marinibactrum halimedae]MCD9459156.1 hypothetical protein [Marinibactrum halimedae]GLS24757.1 hypothetical protein GCM10007877_04710 [Marinibactrum halimedae]
MPTSQVVMVDSLYPIGEGRSGHTSCKGTTKFGPIDPKTLFCELTASQDASMKVFVEFLVRMGVDRRLCEPNSRLCPHQQYEVEDNKRRAMCACAEFEALLDAIREKGLDEIVRLFKANKIAFVAHDDAGSIMAPCDNCLSWLQPCNISCYSYHWQLTNANDIPLINHFR